MNIYDLQIGFGNEVPDLISLNIYFSGCKNNKKCERDLCQNKHLHDFDNGMFYTKFYDDISNILNKDLVQCVCYLGGEPLDQGLSYVTEITNYIRSIRPEIDIYCYTGYDYEDVPTMINFVNQLKIKDIYVNHYSSNESNQYWLNNSFTNK